LKILIVEDDRISSEMLLQLLTESNYTIDSASNTETGWQYIKTYIYDLIVLDISLTDSDGIDLCTKLRTSGYTIPVLLLTTKDPNELVLGLEAGADKHLVKPYKFQELMARIKSLLRCCRDRDTLSHYLTWEKIHLDLNTNVVTYDQKNLCLTQKEYGLLEIFLRYPNQVFSNKVLLNRVWSVGEESSEEVVTTHIKELRQKLRAAGLKIDPIETLYGLKYRLQPAPVKSLEIPTQFLVAKPLPSEKSSSLIDTTRVREVMMLMSKKLIAKLPEAIAMFRQLASNLQNGHLAEDLRFDGYMEAHRLIGSLGSLGFLEASKVMRQIEQMLKSDFALAQTDAVMLLKLIVDLETNNCELLPTVKSAQSQSQSYSHNLLSPLLLIVDDDADFIKEVELEAETWEIRVQTVGDLVTAKEKIVNEPPDVILLDIRFLNTIDNGLTLLNELAQHKPKIPTVIVTAAAKLSDRVIAVRRGGCSFIEKPALTQEIFNTILQVLQQQRDRPKVMIVDDDPMSLVVLELLLNRWDIEVTTLQNPKLFWDVLESTSPDLLILDWNMPKYSGLDLCQAVRMSPLWHDLPIIFVSSNCDRETIHQLFAAGADDYLSKASVETDLYPRIFNRIERRRQSRQIADFDRLTGVYTYSRGMQSLTKLLQLATRNQQTLCVAILDLDVFKLVNDRYGHSMGDVILKQFGKLLRQYFRNEDVTMRWGGDEFVVSLYGANLQQSIQRLNTVLETWRELKILTVDKESISITFSVGVAEYPQDGTNLEMLFRSMKTALYQAKAAGRNQIMAAGELRPN